MSTLPPLPDTAAVANWYGSNRMLAASVGAELRGCTWVGVPFAGGMCEVAHIEARTLQVNDLHRHVINLARVIAFPPYRVELFRALNRLPFHPDVLSRAQEACKLRERVLSNADDLFAPAFPLVNTGTPDVQWACDYFICSWMGRGGQSGQKGEFRGGLSIRWTAEGGGSNTRFRSAIRSLAAWGKILRRCDFTTLDATEFLESCTDKPKNGIYCDPPFPGPGDLYKHSAGEEQQRVWARLLSRFTAARVVVRYHDHPLIRELYPEGRWTWIRRSGRDRQNNGSKPEVLLINGPSLAGGEVAGG